MRYHKRGINMKTACHRCRREHMCYSNTIIFLKEGILFYSELHRATSQNRLGDIFILAEKQFEAFCP